MTFTSISRSEQFPLFAQLSVRIGLRCSGELISEFSCSSTRGALPFVTVSALDLQARVDLIIQAATRTAEREG